MSREEIEAFFALCSTKSKGVLTFEEFKQLYNNEEADNLFRQYIMRARKLHADNGGKEDKDEPMYLPFNLSRLLEHMTLKQRRETVHKRIDETKHVFDKTNECVRNFVKLFIIDRGAIDTMSKDETSRKIAIALQ